MTTTWQSNDTDQQLEDLRKQVEILKLQQQLQQLQGNQNGQGGQQFNNAPVHKENVQLTCYTVKGTVLGQAQAQLKATLLDSDGVGVQGASIVFVVSNTRREIGRGTTNGQGDAVAGTGSNILDPTIMLSGVGSGVTAIFNGNKQYLPAEARGTVEPSIG
ncbi:hypothetical protein ACFVVX_19025 [Kitasatospora sp. NPDC058170]|uniref:hypothetical protein n=1 Tax=Kitasatospora sp. NPDC058170 TaxID=3346364 RepID=UPI0036DEF725